MILFADGASRGNPGPAAIGASLQKPTGEETGFVSESIGETTNNEAEYRALIEGLKLAHKKRVKAIEVRADSELMVRQMLGEYKVKAPHLKPLFSEALDLSRRFKVFAIRHIPREENSRADELANRALDRI